MASFDSIVIGEDWISEHYFTTDSAKESFHGKVLELRKLWDAEKKEGRTTVRDDLLAATKDLQTALAGLAENPDNASEVHALVRTTFGYPAALSAFTAERAGSELEIPNAKLDGVAEVLFMQAAPVASIEYLLDPDTGLLITAAVEDGKRSNPRQRRCRQRSGRMRRQHSWWCRPVNGCCSPRRNVGRRAATWPSTCSSSRSVDMRPRRRDRPCRSHLRQAGAPAGCRRKRVVGGGAQGFGQAHRRGIERPA